jgi:hypothetical protein
LIQPIWYSRQASLAGVRPVGPFACSASKWKTTTVWGSDYAKNAVINNPPTFKQYKLGGLNNSSKLILLADGCQNLRTDTISLK